MSGWVCSYRKIWKNEFFKGNGMRVAVWHWLLHHAAWEDTAFSVTDVDLIVKRGEVCFSQKQITNDTGATRKQIRDVLEYLVGTGSMAKIGANKRANVRANARSLYRIEKYEEYQQKKTSGANEGAIKGPIKEQVNNIPVGTADKSAVIDPTKIMFDSGIKLLGEAGHSQQKARTLLGKWKRDHGTSLVIDALGQAQRAGAIEPVSFCEGIFRFKAKRSVDRPGFVNAGAFGNIPEIN